MCFFFFNERDPERRQRCCGESARCTCICILGRCLPDVGAAFSPPEKRDCVCTGNAAPFATKTLGPPPGLREWDCGCELLVTEADSSKKGVADQTVWLLFPWWPQDELSVVPGAGRWAARGGNSRLALAVGPGPPECHMALCTDKQICA